jgi:hypothetical protein
MSVLSAMASGGWNRAGAGCFFYAVIAKDLISAGSTNRRAPMRVAGNFPAWIHRASVARWIGTREMHRAFASGSWLDKVICAGYATGARSTMRSICVSGFGLLSQPSLDLAFVIAHQSTDADMPRTDATLSPYARRFAANIQTACECRTANKSVAGRGVHGGSRRGLMRSGAPYRWPLPTFTLSVWQ